MKTQINGNGAYSTQKKKRPGVHAKTKTSSMKQSSQYKKKYRGQGK